MKKKIYSLAVVAALFAGMLPVGVSADANMGISSIKAEATGIRVTFTENIDAASVAGNILVIDEATGTDITDGDISVTEAEVFIPIKPSVGKEVVLGIDNDITSASGNTLDKDYIQTYTLSGVLDDFTGADGSDAGWGANCWGVDNGGAQINIHDNKITPVLESALSAEQHMFFRDDYLSQKITGSQSVSFDYLPYADNVGDYRAYVDVYLMADGISFSKSDTKVTTSAYMLEIGYSGNSVGIYKQSGARNIADYAGVSNNGLTTLKEFGWASISKGETHKVRFVAEQVEEGVELTVYVDGIKKLTCIDTDSPLTGGTSFFVAAKNRSDAVNKYDFDNIAFAQIQSVTATEPTDYVSEVIAEINAATADQQEELDAIGGKIKLIENLGIAFDAEAKQKFTELNSFEISKAEVASDEINVKFNKKLSSANLNDYIKVYDGTALIDTTCTLDSEDTSLVKVALPDEVIGKELMMTVKAGLTSASGATVLTDNYKASFTYKGYKDTFDQDPTGWSAKAWSHGSGMALTVYGGGIKLIGSDKGTYTSGSESIEYARQPLLVYRNDYTDYKMQDQTIEFDYMREFSNAPNDGAKDSVRFDAYLMVDNMDYVSGDSNLNTDGYYMTIAHQGEKLAIGKRKAEDGYFNMDVWDGSLPGTILASDTAISFKDATRYSIKFEAKTVSDGVKLTVYVKENGVYVETLTATDTTSPLTGGTTIFVTGRSQWAANAHILDNIKYTGNSQIALVNFNTRLAEIEARLTEIETTVIDWNTDEIKTEVQGYKDELTIFAGSTAVDAVIAKAQKILDGKDETEICRALSAEVIAKLKAKYENNEQIIVSGIGGSLTQGGVAMGKAVVKYIADSVGATITVEDIAVYHSTDLENGETINANKKFVYLNAGNGGQASDWHSVRLYSDVIQYNPDVVLIDYAGNDDTLGARDSDGEHPTKSNTETIIRKLLKLENAPQVMMIYIPTEQHIAQALYKEAGIKGTYEGTDTYTIGKFDESSYVYQREIAKHYGIAQLDLVQIFADNATLDYGAEAVEAATAYYKVSGGNVPAESTDSGATKVIAKSKKHIPVIDWQAIATKYGLDLAAYTPNTLDKITTDYSNAYTTGMTDDELLNTFQRLGADKTHSTEAGYQFYADIITKLLTSDRNAAMRTVNSVASPIKVPVYDDINLKRFNVTKDLIDASDRFNVTGAYEDADFMSNRGVARRGVKFTGPATIEIKFTGNAFYVESTDENRTQEEGSTQTATYSNGLSKATIDGMAYNFDYNEIDGNHTNGFMLTNDEEHTLSITVDEGKYLYLANLYLDESADWDNSTLAADKYVTVDITKAANIYGAASEKDGKVFSNYFWKWKDGAKDESAEYINQSLQDQETYKPTILIGYEEDSYVNLYYNDKEQVISQWPNGDGQYSGFDKIENNELQFTEKNLEAASRWQNAKDAFALGYFGADYRLNRVDIESVSADGTVTLSKKPDLGICNSVTNRWKIVHLLEEIDVPGEWYIDHSTMMLYYYPPYDFGENSKIELSTLKNDMIRFEKAENITINNLDFSQTRGHAIVNYLDKGNTDGSRTWDNFTIEGCSFDNIGGYGINFHTYIFNNINSTGQRMGYVKNLLVQNNTFYNMWLGAWNIYSGDSKTIDNYNTVIQNNYVNQPSYMTNANIFGNVSGVGIKVLNNLGHNGAFQALNFSGSENEIKNNSVYNSQRETLDAGTFYTGRNIYQRNNVLSNNFIYRARPVDEAVRKFCHNKGIYFDDGYAASKVEKNIVVDSGTAMSTSGSGSEYYNNISVDCINGIEASINRGINDYAKTNYEFFYGDEFDEALRNTYLNKFSEIQTEYEKLNEINYETTVLNKVSGNYFVNGILPETKVTDIAKANNTYTNNIKSDSYDAFINPDALDFRVKTDSAVYEQSNGLPSQNDTVGMVWEDTQLSKEEIKAKSGFKKLYPENSASLLENEKVHFMWEKTYSADEYRFIIATDAELQNIVFERTVPYNYCDVENLSFNSDKYYWNVYAINETKELKGEWLADDDAFSVMTGTQKESFALTECTFLGNKIKIEFNDNIKSSSVEENIGIYDEANAKVSVQVTTEGNVIWVELPNSLLNKNCTLKIGMPIKNYDGEKLSHSYKGTFKGVGFFEDFGDGYSEGDWIQNEMKSKNNSESMPAQISDGELYICRKYDTTNTPIYVYKNDFENYNYNNSVLEFDYTGISAYADGDYQNKFGIITKLNNSANTQESPIYTSEWHNYINSGYLMELAGTNRDLKVISVANENSWIPYGNANIKAGNLCVKDNTYRIRIETRTASDGVYTDLYKAAYSNNALSDYQLVMSEKMDDTITEPGCFAFGGNNGSYTENGVTTYYYSQSMIDNCLYAQIDTIEMVENNDLYVTSTTRNADEIVIGFSTQLSVGDSELNDLVHIADENGLIDAKISLNEDKTSIIIGL